MTHPFSGRRTVCCVPVGTRTRTGCKFLFSRSCGAAPLQLLNTRLLCHIKSLSHWQKSKSGTLSLQGLYFLYSVIIKVQKSLCSAFSVPMEIPQNFRLNPEKEVTDTTADFLWDSVNTGPWRMQGFFTGYKVRRFLHASHWGQQACFTRACIWWCPLLLRGFAVWRRTFLRFFYCLHSRSETKWTYFHQSSNGENEKKGTPL